MSEQFKNWISNKNYEIISKNDGKSDKTESEFVIANNDSVKTEDIKVYLSKASIVESIVSRIDKTVTTDALKLFNNFKQRKTVLRDLISRVKESAKVLEFLETITTNSSIKVSRNRIQNLLKDFDYGLNYQIFNHFNEFNFKAIDYSLVKVFNSESFLLKIIHEVVNHLIAGTPFRLIVDSKSALFGSFFLDLLESSGFDSGIDLIIVDNKTATKLNRSTKPSISPIFVVFESADIESAVHRLIKSYIIDTFGSINVFVQQSIHKKFSERVRTRSTNNLIIGDRFDEKSDVVSKVEVNYEAIDFDNQSTGIQVFKFRTNEEIKSLVKHFTQIPFISLWAEKTSLALELAKSVDSSSFFFINGSLESPKRREFSPLDNVSDKTDFDVLYGQKKSSFESIVNSSKKWRTTSSEERLRTIKNFFVSNETKVSFNTSSLEMFNQKITEIKDNFGSQLTISDFEPIGLLSLKISDDLDQRVVILISEALISGNALIINCFKPIDDLRKLSEYLTSLGFNCLLIVDIDDKDVIGNSVLTFGGNAIGLHLQDSKRITRNSLIKLNKTITLSFGDISFAK